MIGSVDGQPSGGGRSAGGHQLGVSRAGAGRDIGEDAGVLAANQPQKLDIP